MPSPITPKDSDRLVKDDEYAREASAQIDWLNWVFAFATFGLAITCLQFKSPQRPALLCLLVVGPMYWHALKSIPPSLRALKDLQRESSDPRVSAEIDYLVRKYHGWKSLPRHLAFLAAPVVYFLVLFFGNTEIFSWFQK